MLNPLSNDLATLRQSLLFSGLEAISYNINRRNSNLKLFEFGKSYHKFLSGFEEHKHLTLFLTGNRAKESWTTAQNRLTSSYLKAMLMLYSLDLEFKKTKCVTSDVFQKVAIGAGHNALVEFGS
jgi:phenylalanyl-tRNA synthetase beta chain